MLYIVYSIISPGVKKAEEEEKGNFPTQTQQYLLSQGPCNGLFANPQWKAPLKALSNPPMGHSKNKSQTTNPRGSVL